MAKKKKSNKAGKGPKFERDILKQFSLWWTEGQRDDVFWRTSGSGARATTRMKSDSCTAYSAGDMGCIDPIGIPFLQLCLVEMKRGYSGKPKIYIEKKTGKAKIRKGQSIDILSCIDTTTKRKTNPLLIDWWLKAEKERKQHGRKLSLIIIKRDHKEPVVVMSYDQYLALSYLSRLTAGPKIMITPYDLVIFLLEDFFRIFKPKHFEIFKDIIAKKKKKRRKIKIGG